MQLTIRDLIDKPELKIELMGGHKGAHRKIVWAHTSELENPSEWVLPNHLIMTTGLGIPKNGLKQKDYIMRLIHADLAGLMISTHMSAPKDLKMLIEVADQYDFPVLFIDYHVPFIEIAKIIIEANKDKKEVINNQLVKLLYEHSKELIREHNVQELTARVTALLNMPIDLVNSINPKETLFSFEPLSEARLKLLSTLDLHSDVPQKIYQKTAPTLNIIPLKSHGISLVIEDSNISSELLQSLTLLFSLYIEMRKENAYQRSLLSSEFLDDILNERISDAYIEKKLPNYNVSIDNCIAIIAKPKPDINYQKVFFKFAIRGLCLFQKQRVFLLTEAHNVEKLANLFEHMGISDLIKQIKRINDAFAEAKLAYKNTTDALPVQHYAKQNYSRYTLPRNLQDAERIFELNLGALHQQDQQKNTRYVHTLKVFLENDRAWEKTAKQLHIHKQTLVYRMQKIQEITTRTINSTADIVELWIAIKAGEILGYIEENH